MLLLILISSSSLIVLNTLNKYFSLENKFRVGSVQSGPVFDQDRTGPRPRIFNISQTDLPRFERSVIIESRRETSQLRTCKRMVQISELESRISNNIKYLQYR
ncbi:unnamed protein product [Rhizophagus irregularis]|nr:unnamed protein product [Rhizophagus irregularis]CAB4439827.1 unnamed protein product [Rhizophagus irregularis]